MSQEFLKAYKLLNNEQKQAVDYLDGPLLVIAGPGTGKTQLLGARAANILQKTDVSPENILCLTFTDKAATNMRSRLLELIGSEARNIQVHTFHSLGAEIMHRYAQYFWGGARLEPAPDAVKLEIIESILSSLPLSSPLATKFDGHYTQIQEVSKAIQRAKEAGLTPDKLRALVTSNLAYLDAVQPVLQPLLSKTMSKAVAEELYGAVMSLPDEGTAALTAPLQPISAVLKQTFTTAYQASMKSGKMTPLSAWKADISLSRGGQRTFKDIDRNQWWQELAAVYERYQVEMNHRYYFDFADMILETIVQLETNESLLTEVQERFQHLMIDEFQDTNDAQFRLVYLIANHPAADRRPNIMAVGDDDQAIYRFQGALLSNAANFIDSFQDVKLIILKQNYRSHQSILDQAKYVAEAINYRLVDQLDGVKKDIIAQSTIQKGNIEHILYSSQPHELAGVADLVRDRFDQSEGTIAVLARKHDSLQQLAAQLHRKGIPLRYERTSNVLEHDAVQQILSMLALLEHIQTGHREAVNYLLSQLLAHPMWGLAHVQLWEFATSQRSTSDWLEGMLTHTNDQFRSIGSWLAELSSLSTHENLSVVIEYALGLRELGGMCSPFKDFYLSKDEISDSYKVTLSALGRLRTLADSFAFEQKATLTSFNQFIRLNREHGIVIADESVFVTSERAVQLMTVYKAKGLEFDAVIIIDALDQQWKPRRAGRKPPMNLVSLQEYGEEEDDYARLMYVAMTRAKRNLILTSFKTSEEGREVLPTPLILTVPARQAKTEEDTSVEVLEQAIRWPELDHIDARLALSSVLDSYELAVTHILNFLDITAGGPRYFLERNFLRLPDIKKPSLAFGTAIHAALREAQLLKNADKLDNVSVLQVFERTLRNQQIETSQETRYRIHGEELLQRLLTWDGFELPKGSVPEKEIHGVQLGEARLGGSLDRIDTQQDELLVVDYKTGGSLHGQLTNTTKGEGVKAWRHRTQLIFYALLLRESGYAKSNQSITGQMVYLETDDPKQLVRSYRPTSEDLERMKRLVATIWQHVQELDLPDISSYPKDLSGIVQFEDDLIEGMKA